MNTGERGINGRPNPEWGSTWKHGRFDKFTLPQNKITTGKDGITPNLIGHRQIDNLRKHVVIKRWSYVVQAMVAIPLFENAVKGTSTISRSVPSEWFTIEKFVPLVILQRFVRVVGQCENRCQRNARRYFRGRSRKHDRSSKTNQRQRHQTIGRGTRFTP